MWHPASIRSQCHRSSYQGSVSQDRYGGEICLKEEQVHNSFSGWSVGAQLSVSRLWDIHEDRDQQNNDVH